MEHDRMMPPESSFVEARDSELRERLQLP
jgi:hypothetical protein